MKLFQLRDRGCYSPGFPYAHTYGKPDRPIPFWSSDQIERKSKMWDWRNRPHGIVTGDAGTKWGDFMMCGFAPPRTFISHRVLESLRKMPGQILTETEFPVAEVKSKKLRDVPPPRYFAPQWAPGIEVDWDVTGRERDEAANMRPLVAKLSTWNGADIFSWANWDETRLTMLCTEKIVELAEKEKWTNAEFKPVLTC